MKNHPHVSGSLWTWFPLIPDCPTSLRLVLPDQSPGPWLPTKGLLNSSGDKRVLCRTTGTGYLPCAGPGQSWAQQQARRPRRLCPEGAGAEVEGRESGRACTKLGYLSSGWESLQI